MNATKDNPHADTNFNYEGHKTLEDLEATYENNTHEPEMQLWLRKDYDSLWELKVNGPIFIVLPIINAYITIQKDYRLLRIVEDQEIGRYSVRDYVKMHREWTEDAVLAMLRTKADEGRFNCANYYGGHWSDVSGAGGSFKRGRHTPETRAIWADDHMADTYAVWLQDYLR